jgi:rhomboid family GlyGly-CTERM serine protease
MRDERVVMRLPTPPADSVAQGVGGLERWLVGLLLLALVLLALGGERWVAALRYERHAIEGGEYWRLLSGHFVHGTVRHLLLNCLGLLAVAALFPREYSAARWLFILGGSVLAIDLGFVLYEPQLEWYVGFSGVLHGALAAGVVAWWCRENKVSALVLGAALLGKLAWEQTRGALPFSGDMPVIVEAHLYGAVGGALAALLLSLVRRYWPFQPRSL